MRVVTWLVNQCLTLHFSHWRMIVAAENKWNWRELFRQLCCSLVKHICNILTPTFILRKRQMCQSYNDIDILYKIIYIRLGDIMGIYVSVRWCNLSRASCAAVKNGVNVIRLPGEDKNNVSCVHRPNNPTRMPFTSTTYRNIIIIFMNKDFMAARTFSNILDIEYLSIN